MKSPREIISDLRSAMPGTQLELWENPSDSAGDALLVSAADARNVALYLRDDPALRLDYCSNVTGLDWPPKTTIEKKVVKSKNEAGEDIESTEQVEHVTGGYLETVYHLYSMALKHGPVILRMRTENRSDRVNLPSLTPVWRSCEFQEREVFDLYGIQFDDHPDLRRLLMWDEFVGHPMRRDYEPPADDLDDLGELADNHEGKEPE